MGKKKQKPITTTFEYDFVQDTILGEEYEEETPTGREEDDGLLIYCDAVFEVEGEYWQVTYSRGSDYYVRRTGEIDIAFEDTDADDNPICTKMEKVEVTTYEFVPSTKD